jgi:hypothetical protein
MHRSPGDHALKNVTSKPELSHSAIETNSHLFDDWFDPIEDMIRGQVRGLIEQHRAHIGGNHEPGQLTPRRARRPAQRIVGRTQTGHGALLRQ